MMYACKHCGNSNLKQIRKRPEGISKMYSCEVCGTILIIHQTGESEYLPDIVNLFPDSKEIILIDFIPETRLISNYTDMKIISAGYTKIDGIIYNTMLHGYKGKSKKLDTYYHGYTPEDPTFIYLDNTPDNQTWLKNAIDLQINLNNHYKSIKFQNLEYEG